MTKIVNLTPHTIVVRVGDVETTFPVSGTVARVASKMKDVGTIAGIPVKSQIFGEVEGLPAPEDGTVYVVSALVLARAKEAGRTDVVAPNTAQAIRDEQGRIVAVPGFVG